MPTFCLSCCISPSGISANSIKTNETLRLENISSFTFLYQLVLFHTFFQTFLHFTSTCTHMSGRRGSIILYYEYLIKHTMAGKYMYNIIMIYKWNFLFKEAEDDLFKQQFKRFRKPNPHDLTEVIDFDQPDKFDEVCIYTYILRLFRFFPVSLLIISV